LNTAISDARFDEQTGLWTLTTSDGDTITARVVVSGVGGLVDPASPDIKGIEEFTGEMFHTARWNHDYDLTGKNVAVIGTGASAIQVIPAIAARVGRLSVFQRTAHWIMPKGDWRISERTKRLFARFPLALKATRFLLFWMSEALGPLVILDTRLSKLPERVSLKHLEKSVSDPELREKLKPSFQFGCKRVLISDDYWPSLERENVELVTEGIARICSEGIETEDGVLHSVDAIVLATGFDTGLAMAPFPIAGLGGRMLDDAWRQGATAYKGMTVSGFPNWFIIMGPNTGPGHTSVLVYTESQILYILQAIKRLISEDIKYFDVKEQVQDKYNAGIQGRMKHTSWTSGCNSWYLTETGENRALYPGLASEYCARIRRFRPSEYDVVEL